MENPIQFSLPSKTDGYCDLTKQNVRLIPILPSLILKNQTILFQIWKILDFSPSPVQVPEFDLNKVVDYDKTRNIPSLDSTSKIGHT